MAIYKTPIEQLKRVQEEMRAEQLKEEPTIANVEAATAAHDEGRVIFRKTAYRVPPIPFRSRLELMALDQEFRRVTQLEPEIAVIERTRDLVVEMLGLMGTLIRWKWWQVRNPFADADLNELQVIRDFFLTARMKSDVVTVVSIRAPHWLQRTWPISLPLLPVGIRAGLSRASLAAGSTSSLESWA